MKREKLKKPPHALEGMHSKGFLFSVMVGFLFTLIAISTIAAVNDSQKQQAISNLRIEQRSVQSDIIESVQAEIAQEAIVKTRERIFDHLENAAGWAPGSASCDGLYSVDTTTLLSPADKTVLGLDPGLGTDPELDWNKYKLVLDTKLFGGTGAQLTAFFQGNVENSIREVTGSYAASATFSNLTWSKEDPKAGFDWLTVTSSVFELDPSGNITADSFRAHDCTDSSCTGGSFSITLNFENVPPEQRQLGPFLKVSRFASGAGSVETTQLFSVIPSKKITVHVPLRMYKAWWHARKFYQNMAKDSKAIFGESLDPSSGKLRFGSSALMLGACNDGCGCVNTLNNPTSPAPSTGTGLCQNSSPSANSNGCNSTETVNLASASLALESDNTQSVSITAGQYDCKAPGEEVFELALGVLCKSASSTELDNGFQQPSDAAQNAGENRLCATEALNTVASTGSAAINPTLLSFGDSAPFGLVSLGSNAAGERTDASLNSPFFDDNPKITEWKTHRNCQSSCGLKFESEPCNSNGSGACDNPTGINPFGLGLPTVNPYLTAITTTSGYCKLEAGQPSRNCANPASGESYLKCARPIELAPLYLKMEDVDAKKRDNSPMKYCFSLNLGTTANTLIGQIDGNAKSARCSKCANSTFALPTNNGNFLDPGQVQAAYLGGPCDAGAKAPASETTFFGVDYCDGLTDFTESVCAKNSWDLDKYDNLKRCNTSVGTTPNCEPYSCNPHNCNPHNCNPHDCSCDPDGTNCDTCYDTCYNTCYDTCYRSCSAAYPQCCTYGCGDDPNGTECGDSCGVTSACCRLDSLALANCFADPTSTTPGVGRVSSGAGTGCTPLGLPPP